MSDTVVFDINGDPKGAEAAFNRVQKELDKTKAKLGELTAEARKSALAGDKVSDAYVKNAKQGEAMAAGMVKSLAASATAAGLLTAALKITRTEYDNIIQRQQKAASTNISTANAEMAMLRNVSPQDHAYWREQAPAMAQRTGQSTASIFQAIADASSAQGNQSNDQLRRNVELAMRVSPDSPSDAKTIAGGLGDAVGLTGSMDEKVNMGAILAMGKQTRIRSTTAIAERLIPGAISVKGYGGSASEAMAINTTLSTLMNDASGEKTPGSASRIASELDRIYGEKGSPLEHITALQNNPALLKKWYQGSGAGKPRASIPEHAEIAFKNLVTKGSSGDQLLRSNLGGYGDDADMAKLTDEWLKSTYGTDRQKFAGSDRGLAATTNAAELANLPGARYGAMRGRMDEVLQATGASWMERTGYAMRFDVGAANGDDPTMIALDTFAKHRNALQNSPNLTAQQRAANQPSVDILNAVMKEMVAELKGLRTDQKNTKPKNVDGHTE